MKISDFDVLATMQALGGSFAQALAQAFYHADAENDRRLKAAFPELWAEYAELARLRAEREAAKA